jgi:hypothetical protein
MILNRAARKEAESRLARLRKQVSIQVFTYGLEDSTCRETRQLVEELAELTNRLSVEINDASESGDLIRKFRLDALPALVITGKDMPELRIYGAPLVYGFEALLDGISHIGAPGEPKSEYLDRIEALDGGSDAAGSQSKRQATIFGDLVLSRRDTAAPEAADLLWRVALAERLVHHPVSRLAPALRFIEDFPFLSIPALTSGIPALVKNKQTALAWPFSELEALDFIFGGTDAHE